MAARTWDDDFRKHAIEASLRKLGDDDLDDPFRYVGSFCLPVGEKPVKGWTPGRIRTWVMCGCVLLESIFIPYFIVVIATGIDVFLPAIFLQAILLFPGVICIHLVLEQFLISRTGESLILRRLLQRRIAGRLKEFDSSHVIPCELIDPDPQGEKRYLDSDDYVLVFSDETRRRLLIEGVTARYQIEVEDVTRLEKYEWKVSFGVDYYSGTLVTFQIDKSTELTFAAVRKAGYFETHQQLLLWLFLRRARRNSLKRNELINLFKQTLQYSDATGRPKEEIEVEQL